jgi:hypothetical protein
MITQDALKLTTHTKFEYFIPFTCQSISGDIMHANLYFENNIFHGIFMYPINHVIVTQYQV